MTKTAKTFTTPEEIFCEALTNKDYNLTPSDIRLLTSGFVALKQKQQKVLNAIETKAIDGMIAYVAYTQKANEDTVRSVVTANFGVEEVALIPSERYAAVVEYLVDLKMDVVLN